MTEDQDYQNEIGRIKRLRAYYSTQYPDNDTDACFLMWLQIRLAEIGGYSLDTETP